MWMCVCSYVYVCVYAYVCMSEDSFGHGFSGGVHLALGDNLSHLDMRYNNLIRLAGQ